MNLQKINTGKKGFSIIEIIVFMTLLSVVLVAGVGYTARLIITMSHNRHQLLATHYTDELKEWLGGEREVDWENFQDHASVAGIEYCLNNRLDLSDTIDTILTSASLGGCSFTGVSGTDPLIYQRTLFLRKDVAETATRLRATIRVAWRDEGVLYQEEVQTVYSVWE